MHNIFLIQPTTIFLFKVMALVTCRPKQMLDQNKSWAKTNVEPRQKLGQNQSFQNKTWGKTKVGPKQKLGLKKVGPQQKLGQNKSWAKTKVGPKKSFTKTKVGPKQKLGQSKCWTKTRSRRIRIPESWSSCSGGCQNPDPFTLGGATILEKNTSPASEELDCGTPQSKRSRILASPGAKGAGF